MNEMVARAVVRELAAMPARLGSVLELVPAEALDFVPDSWDGIPGETLTVRGQLCHLRDIEIDGYQVRIDRLLNETMPSMPSIDGYELAERRNYAAQDAAAVLAEFAAARARTVEIASRFQGHQLSRPGRFDGFGEVTLLGVLSLLSSHDLQHLAGLYWLLAKAGRRAPAGNGARNEAVTPTETLR